MNNSKNHNADQGQDVQSNKRGSIYSLYNIQTNSIMNYKTLTMNNTKSDIQDDLKSKTEVTLGADKRRRLLSQEDFDLRTLNQKKSLKSEAKNKVEDSPTVSSKDIEIEFDQEQDLVINDVNGLEQIIKNNTNNVEQKYSNYKSQPSSQILNQLIILNEESLNHLNDQTQSDSSVQGHARINAQQTGNQAEKPTKIVRKSQSRNTVIQNNTQSFKNTSNIPSPLNKSQDQSNLDNTKLFGQQISITAIQADKNTSMINDSFIKKPQYVDDIDIDGNENEFKKQLKNQNQSFQATNSLQLPAGEGSLLLQQKIRERGETPVQKVNGLKSFQHFLFMSKAKKRLMNFLSKERFKNIDNFHLGLINDVTALESNDQDNKLSSEERKIQRLSREQFDEFKTNSQVLQPDSMLLIAWNIMVFLILLFLIISTPIVRAYDTGYQHYSGMDALQRYISVIILICDIVISFNKGYYDEGMIITNRKKIIKNYCKAKFFFDVFNVICCILFEEINIYLVFAVSICRLAFCSKIWTDIDEYLEISYKFTTISELVELMLLIFLIAHLCACGFFYVSKNDYQNGVSLTWITYQKIELSEWQVQYIYSIYFEFITMTTIGYGDIFPCSKNERLYVIFMTLVSCAVFGYSLNAIGQIFRDLSMQLSSFKQTKYDISKYLKSRNITKRVQLKIFKYLEYLNRQESEGHFFMKGEKILNRVSQNLREEVYREYYGKILSQISFLTKNFSKNFLNELPLYMKELNLAPGESLFKEGAQDTSLFFLSKGVLELYVMVQSKNDKLQEKVLHRYQGGSLIGHQEFLTDKTRQFSARSLSISHFVYIKKADFLQIIERYPLDYENFCSLKDDLLFKGQDRFSLCESCKQSGHSILKCNFIFSNYNKIQIIKKVTYSESQKRAKYQSDLAKSNNYNLQDSIQSDNTEIKRKISKKKRWERVNVRQDLMKFRKDFINEAIRKNRRNDSDCIKELNDSDESLMNQNSHNQQSNLETSNHLQQFHQNGIIGSFATSQRQKTNSMSYQDSLTMKSFTRNHHSEYSANENDRQFYKKYPKIHYEDEQFLILSSSQHSSSELEEEMEEDDEFYDDIQPQQIFFGEYKTDDEYYISDQRRVSLIEQQLRNQGIKRNTAIRPGTGISPNVPSPNNKISSVINTMDTSVQLNQFTFEQTNPQIARIMNTQSNSSSNNSLPISNLSSFQYQKQNSFSTNQTSQNITSGSQQTIQSSPQSNMNPLANQIPPGSSINQLIIGRNYFESQEFQEETNQIFPQSDHKKLSIFLPTVDEASEQNEQSTNDMVTSFGQQQSPMLRNKNRESSQRKGRKLSSQSTLPRQDSINSIRRKSSRNDSTNTTKLMKESQKSRKVTYMDSSGILRDQILGHGGSSQTGSYLQNTFSKSISRSSRHLPTTNQYDRSRSKQSQGTYLNNNPNHQSMYIYTFDQMKEYKYYYPHNNIQSILKSRIKNFRRKKIYKNKKINLSNSNVGFIKSGNHNFSTQNQTKIVNMIQNSSFTQQYS